MNQDAKIYVAGHRGLVGSAICRVLHEQGFHNIIGRTHAELDLLDPVATRDFFDSERPEYVVLAAALVGGIMANSTYPADFIYQNLQIQQNVIGESFRHDVKKLLFLGSTCIYPRMAPQPISESALLTSSLEPTNEPYALAKIAGLKMCEAFNRQYGTNYISVMPTNLYGPNDNFDLMNSHVLPAMVRKIHLAKCVMDGDDKALLSDLERHPVEGIAPSDGAESVKNALDKRFNIHNGSITLWGTGEPLREFLWSEDMADACVFLLHRVDARQLADMGTSFLNVGTGIEHTIAQVAHMVAATVGYKGSILFDASKPDGTPRKLTDPSRLHALGWRHKVELAGGIKQLYDWYLAVNENAGK